MPALMGNLIHKIKQSLAGHRATGIPSYFESMEPRVLMSAVRAIPKAAVPPTISITASDAKATESAKNNQNAAFTVSRAGGIISSDLVVYYTIAGTATNGVDYETLTGQVTIPAGKKSAIIAINVIDDAICESSESVVISLYGTDGYFLNDNYNQRHATATINDNECVVTIKATDKTAKESLDSKDTGTFTVTRSGGDIGKDLVVYYSVDVSQTHTAVAGGDYAKLSGSVTILAGQKSAQITVKPLDDAKSETDEGVTLRLKEDTSYKCDATKPATVTIKDWELAPSSIGNYTFETTTVDSATGTLAGTDGFSIFITPGNSYSGYSFPTWDGDPNTTPFGLLSKTGNVWETAEIRYERLTSNEAIFVTTSLGSYGVVTGKLKFIKADQLTYEITVADGSTITGTMKMSTSGDAPTQLDDWRIKANISEGTGDFASSGNFSIAIDGTNYRLNVGGTITTGKISSTVHFNDHYYIVKVRDFSFNAVLTMYLNFSAPGKASYYMTGVNGYQRGTISFATPKQDEWWYNPGGSSSSGSINVGNIIGNGNYPLPTYVNVYQVITSSGSTFTNTAGGFGTISLVKSYEESESKKINPTDEWLNRYLYQPIMNGFVDGLDASSVNVLVQPGNYATVTFTAADGRSSTFEQNSNKWWVIKSDNGLGSDITDINPVFANLY